MTIASIPNATCGLTTQHQDEAVGLVGRFLNCIRGVSFCEFLPLSALKSPPLSVVEVSNNVDSLLRASSPPISIRSLHAVESGNELLTERFKAVPGKIGIVEGQEFRIRGDWRRGRVTALFRGLYCHSPTFSPQKLRCDGPGSLRRTMKNVNLLLQLPLQTLKRLPCSVYGCTGAL